MKPSNVDPNRLIAFRKDMMRFNRTLSDDFSRMRSGFRNLGQTWRDAKYDEFEHALQEVTKGIEKYLAVTGDFEKHLLKLIKIQEEYHNQRLR